MRLTEQECRERMGAARVAHLATTGADGAPHLVPITFALTASGDGQDRLVTAVDQKPKTTRDLRRLRNIAENPKVAVLGDHYDDDWTRLWWVRVDGVAHVVDGGSEGVAALAALSARYAQYRDDPPRGPVIVVTVHTWSGWSAAN